MNILNNLEQTQLEKEFHLRMVKLYEDGKDQIEYNATRFCQMITKHRGVETARKLLASDEYSEGMTKLWEKGRLDLSVEAVVVREEKWHPLFTDEELDVARERIRKHCCDSDRQEGCRNNGTCLLKN